MIHAIQSEWIKLRTVVSTWILIAVAIVFVLAITLTTTLVIGQDDARTFTGGDLTDLVAGLAIVSALLVGTAMAASTTSEFSNNTIRPTFTGLPDRYRTLTAKPVVYGVTAMVVMVVTVGLSWGVGSAIIGSRDGSAALDDVDTIKPALLGVVILGLLLTLLGYGLGLLIRNPAATICTLLLWPLIAESLIGALLDQISDGATKFLPYQEGFQLALLDPDSQFFGRIGGGLYFAAWVAVVVALGVFATTKRDA